MDNQHFSNDRSNSSDRHRPRKRIIKKNDQSSPSGENRRSDNGYRPARPFNPNFRGPQKSGPPFKKHFPAFGQDDKSVFSEFPDGYVMRLNRYLAVSGVCSRREADKFIVAGVVSVNGVTITELGAKIKVEDDIRYNGQRLVPERKLYLVLNKPKNYVTTANDPHAEKTVMELVKSATNRRIFPVGRLDRMTTGVLIFTNDGELTKTLTHPSSKVKKIYHVFLDRVISPSDIDKIASGVTLEDGFFKPDLIDYVSAEDKHQVGIEIHSGRNRIVRRLFETLGYKIKKLDRVYFAGITKKKLAPGKWRFLSREEVLDLKNKGE